MRSVALAEWLLARFMQSARAEAVVGDLQETAGRESGIVFWRLVLSLLWTLAWRPGGGFLLAAFGGAFVLLQLQKVVFGVQDLQTLNALQHGWVGLLALVAPCLWVSALYCAMRFGLRDAMAWISVTMAIVPTVAVCLWREPWMPFLLGGVVTVALLAAMSYRKGRRGVVAAGMLAAMQPLVWLTGVTVFGTCFLIVAVSLSRLFDAWRTHFPVARPFCDGTMDVCMNGMVNVGLPACYLLLTGLVCAACVRVHRRMLEGVVS